MLFTERWKHINVKIGIGNDDLSMEHGSFHYQEQKLWEEQLFVKPEKDQLILTDAQGRETGCVRFREGESGHRLSLSLCIYKKEINRISVTFPAKKGEHFYGCGETFTKFDLRGERVRIWVAEHQNAVRIGKKLQAWQEGKKAVQLPFSEYESYYAQPTFVSDRCYFLHVNTDKYAEFDFREEDKITLHLREAAEIIIGQEETFPELSKHLSALLGGPAPLPDWIFDGVVIGTQGGIDTINEKLRTAKQAGIPVTGVWSQDWCGYRRTEFGYQVMWNWEADEEQYANLKEQIVAWKKQGVHFLGYINPFLAVEKPLYAYASAHGYCVRNRQGGDYLVTTTTFPAAMIDLTNPEACRWIKSVIRHNMIDVGLSGWMADFGEYLPVDAVLWEGEAENVHNTWPAIWAGLNREAVREAGKEGEILFFTRAGHTGTVGQTIMMWNGDQHVDFSMDDGLASVIPATLSLSVSGIHYTHSDVGGYTTFLEMTRSRELMMRWEEMNAFSILMRFHEGNQPWRNVQFDHDGELLRFLKKTADWHVKLKPYLKRCVREAREQRLPVIRPLFYHYSEEGCFTENYEYLLGRDILVAPVLQEGESKRTVYLPQDSWIHLFSGERFTGGTVTVSAPVGTPPVFVREQAAEFWKEWDEK